MIIFFRITGKLNSTPFSRNIVMTSVSESKIFKGTIDRYNGITVDSISEGCEPHIFHTKLAGKPVKRVGILYYYYCEIVYLSIQLSERSMKKHSGFKEGRNP